MNVANKRIPVYECPSSPKHGGVLDHKPEDGAPKPFPGIVAVGDYGASLGVSPDLPGIVEPLNLTYYPAVPATGSLPAQPAAPLKIKGSQYYASRPPADPDVLTNGMLPKNSALTFGDITDGLSQTIAIFESGGRPFLYRLGRQVGSDLSVHRLTVAAGLARPATYCSPARIPLATCRRLALLLARLINKTNGYDHGPESYAGTAGYPLPWGTEGSSQPYSFHPGGLNALIGDGAVKFIDEATHIGVLAALVTRSNAGGEDLNGDGIISRDEWAEPPVEGGKVL